MARRTDHRIFFTLPLVLSALGLSLPMVSGSSQAPAAKDPVCHECLKIRVGIPRVARGPSPGIPDSAFTEIQLPDGRFRGFSASTSTYAIDGATPSDMGGTPRQVLGKAAPGRYGESGRWINHVERSGNNLLAWVHNETGDAPGQGLKSMSLARSTDEGLSWSDLGQIITGKDPLTKGKVTGDGDCTAVNGQDGYYYAYCLRNGNGGGTIVARAPVSDPVPDEWKKFFQGKWDQPGLGGDATSLGMGMGVSVARWTTTGETVLWGSQGLGFSTDHTTFTHLRDPLLVPAPGTWKRPDPFEFTAYGVLLDARTGGNQLSNSWMIVYTYIQPSEGFGQRYLVFRNVNVSISNAPVTPQVGIQLARWYNPTLQDHWSTTAPVPPSRTGAYKLEKESGYLMTAADAAQPSVELEDCVRQRPGHSDHLLAEKGFCETHQYQRLRTAGWVYSKPQAETIPLYWCYDAREQSHFASNEPDCERIGKMERLLGYALSQ
jgi:hypothetical protein